MTRSRAQDGNALITAILVMFLLLSMAFTTVQVVDTQQKESRRERERESGFQLSEGVLGAEIFQLSRRWPGSTSANPYPTQCVPGSTQSDCPSSQAVYGGFTNKDYNYTTSVAGKRTTWTVKVRDNTTGAGSQFYSDSAVLSQPSYDANGDQLMWVRAQGVVQGHRRTLVALVKAELVTLPPIATKTLVAGYFSTSNNGNKIIVNNGATGEVDVRCGNGGGSSGTTQPPQNGCASYDTKAPQVSGGRVYSYPGLPAHMLDDNQLDVLRARAQADGTYFTSACSIPDWTKLPGGSVVFVEDMGSCGKITANLNIFSAAKPGVLVIGKGSLQLLGTVNFYGVIYHANLDNSNNVLVDISGNGITKGGIVIDGNGGAKLGSSADNLMFDPNAFGNVKGYGTAGIVQNTFREISATS